MEQIFNNTNVYILGAGFSVDGNMPLIKNFLFKMREAAEWVEKQNDTNHFNSINEGFDFSATAECRKPP